MTEHDDPIVGTLIAGWDGWRGWRGHLFRLAVARDHRRQGIGLALLNAAHERLAALGATRIDAVVDNDNPTAHPFYQAAGYDRQPTQSRWDPHPPPATTRRLIKPISGNVGCAAGIRVRILTVRV